MDNRMTDDWRARTASMQHHLTVGPSGHRFRLPDETDVQELIERINSATGPIEIGMVTENASFVTLWLNPAADPWWSIESDSID